MKRAATTLLDEAARLGRFLSVGAAATLLHLGVAVALLALDRAGPVAANGVAFLCALAFSFWGHSRWTFGGQGRIRASGRVARFGRFFLVAAFAFAMNNGVLLVLLGWRLLADEVAVALSVAVIPAATYAANRLWVFR